MQKTYPEYWGCKIQKKKINEKYTWILALPTGYKVKFSSPIGVVGKDILENFYFIGRIGETNIEKKFIVEITKVSCDGKIVGKIRIDRDPPDYYYTTSSIYLSPRGDIYVMNSDESGFWIDCYPTELFDKPEGRDFTNLYPQYKNE
ncbi:MAG: hypothetical protein ACK4F0_01495 [Candidatus Ratteibacteria bacterium]